jgi:acetyl esterase
LVDPDVQKVLYAASRSRAPSYTEIGPQAARALYERTAGVLDVAREPLVQVDEWPVERPSPGNGGSAGSGAAEGAGDHVGGGGAERPPRVRRYCATMPTWTMPQPALLYFHGGGFVIGSIDTHDRLCRRLANLSGCMVLSVDYRLAPEHRFPAAVDDAFATLAWLRREAASLGIDVDRIAVGGDSAGGTLAAACAVHARDHGWPIALQLLIYPGVSPDQSTPSHRAFSEGYLLDSKLIDWFFAQYLRSPGDRNDWRFAPLVHPDLRGVAPAWIALAQYDPLVDEGRLYCERLRAHGVVADCRIFDGMIHSFMQFGGLVEAARKAHVEAAAVLARYLQPGQ